MRPRQSWKFLVVEDIGEATQALQACGIPSTRLSHFEVLTHSGQEHFNKLLQGQYTHLWISLPRKRHERAAEQKHHSKQSKDVPHQARLHSYIETAVKQKTPVFMFGTPGNAWTPYESLVKAQPFNTQCLRCCSLNLRCDTAVPTPSRSYAKLCSSIKLPNNWPCTCQCPWSNHILDWKGSDLAHSRFRSLARQMLVTSAFEAILESENSLSLTPLRLVPRALPKNFKHGSVAN